MEIKLAERQYIHLSNFSYSYISIDQSILYGFIFLFIFKQNFANDSLLY